MAHIENNFHTLILLQLFFQSCASPCSQAVRLQPASPKNTYSVFGALLASFRPSSDINCEWMQTPAEEYGLQEACHILSPLGRTFNLLSRGTAQLQVAQLNDMHLPAFYSHTDRRFKRRESIWSKYWLQMWNFLAGFHTNSPGGPKIRCGLNASLQRRMETHLGCFGVQIKV